MKNKVYIVLIALFISTQIPVFSFETNSNTNIYNTVNVCASYNKNVSLTDLGITALDYNKMSMSDRRHINYLISNLKVDNSRVINKADCRSNVSMSDLGITAQEYLNMSGSNRSRINNLIQNLKNE